MRAEPKRCGKAIRLNYLERHETAENERKRLTKELTVVEHSISAAIDKLMTGVLTDDQAKEYLCMPGATEAGNTAATVRAGHDRIERG